MVILVSTFKINPPSRGLKVSLWRDRSNIGFGSRSQKRCGNKILCFLSPVLWVARLRARLEAHRVEL